MNRKVSKFLEVLDKEDDKMILASFDFCEAMRRTAYEDECIQGKSLKYGFIASYNKKRREVKHK